MKTTDTHRQTELAGFERPKIDELETAANAVDDLEAKRAKLSEKLTQARKTLTHLLIEHEDEPGVYVTEGEDGEREWRYGYERGGKMFVAYATTRTKVGTREAKAEDLQAQLDGEDVPASRAEPKPANGASTRRKKGS